MEDHWHYVRDLTVDGATVDGDGAARILHHAPGAPLTVRYRVVSAYAADPTGDDANPMAVMAGTGVDVRDDLARYIDAREPLALEADQFGDCATVATITIPAFDIGFDRDASAKGGVFSGVDPHGPAYAAGLRDGMKRIGRVEGGREGDSRVAVGYRVAQDGRERTIGWKPEGRGRLTLQAVTLTPGPSDAARAACARQLAGG